VLKPQGDQPTETSDETTGGFVTMDKREFIKLSAAMLQRVVLAP
jgi:hypothetical protein